MLKYLNLFCCLHYLIVINGPRQVQQLLRDEAVEASEWRKLDINGNGNVNVLHDEHYSAPLRRCRSAKANC